MINKQVSYLTLAKAANLQAFGKFPVNFYLRLNQRIWNRLYSLIRSYGVWLHTLVCLRARRHQYVGTFFLRNRPALELIRRLGEQKSHGATLRIVVLGCSI